MASQNLEQGIFAIQQQQLQEGQRLLKIALRNDPLTAEERVRALIWLAETNPDPQFKIQQYQEALLIDPNNQEASTRLRWAQQAIANQQQSSSQVSDFWLEDTSSAPTIPPANNPNWPQSDSQPIQPLNPNWQQGSMNNPPQGQNWQQGGYGNTPSQGMPAANPNPNWPQSDSQPIQPLNPNWQQPDTQGSQPINTNPNWQQQQPGTQGAQPYNPNQNWQQQQRSTQGMPAANPNPNWSNSDSQPYNPNQNWQQPDTQGSQPINTNPNWQQQQRSTQGMPAANPNWQQAQQQSPPLPIPQVQRSVGIFDGPNGNGTGFFVTRDGLIATTRHIVGGERRMVIQLMSGQHLEGQVVRSFPELDLSFIQVNVQLAHLMSTTQMPNFPHNMDIIAVPHAADGLRSTIRATRHEILPHWFPTVINDMPDAGGHPVFDGQRLLIGMLTKNASRANGYMYGLHIHKIYQCVNIYVQEKQQLANENTVYCHACGIVSRAPGFGGFFCENCGNTLPYALNVNRFPQPNMSNLYGENIQHACPNCRSQVGFYNGKCLRCGHEL